MPLARTEIASAVESTPEGTLSLFLPSSVCPPRSSRKMVTTWADGVFGGNACLQLKIDGQLLDALADDLDFGFESSGAGQHDHVEAAFEGGRHVVDAAIAGVEAVAMIENPLLAGTSVASSGDGETLLREDRNERVLYLGGCSG